MDSSQSNDGRVEVLVDKLKDDYPVIQARSQSPVDPMEAMRIKMTDEEVWKQTDERLEKVPYSQLAKAIMSLNSQFVGHCRALRMAARLGKHAQRSIEESVAKEKDFVFYGNMWVLTHKGYVPEKIKKLLDGDVKNEEMEEPEPESKIFTGNGVPEVEAIKKIVDPFL